MAIYIYTGYKIFTIYGSLAVHTYGVFIAVGLLVSVYCMYRNPRFIKLALERSFPDILLVSIISGVVGGRLLEIISSPNLYRSWYDCLAIWEGGFSALGAILGVTMITPLYLMKIQVPVIPVFDLVAIYAPLFQAIARLGCLFAGCCHGIMAKLPWSIVYMHQETVACAGIPVHPTQVYSSMLLFSLFLYMFFIAQYRLKRPGQLFALYLVLASAERFIVDFLRDDRTIVYDSYFSFYQFVAFGIIVTSIVFLTLFPRANEGKML